MPEKSLPNYEVVPLCGDAVRVGVIQSRNKTVDLNNEKRDRKENLEHMCRLIDYAQGHGVRKDRMKDLLIFHEFPFTGWNGLLTREEQYRLAIDADGPEVEAVAKKAKEYQCYIEFGSYARHEGWPGHYVNTGFIVDREGKTILKNWKKRNLPGSGYSTPVFDVLDRFVEMYGWDAVFPVARTDIGNLSIMARSFEPETIRAFAIKGCEIFIHYMTGGYSYRFDVPAQCRTNQIYGVFVNQSAYAGDIRFEDDGAGGSAIFDSMGKVMAEAHSPMEMMISANIPIASFRKTHSIPALYKELYWHLWEEYESKYPPNSYLARLPQSKMDALEQLGKIARW